jgi:hypothetical protein
MTSASRSPVPSAATYSITLVKDATAAFTKEHLHAAVELNGPLYAEAVVPAREVVAALTA